MSGNHDKTGRELLIHADDFGMCQSINSAIVDAFKASAISAASIMTPCPAAHEAIRLCIDHPEWDIGIHLTVTSEWEALRWGPLSPPSAVSSLLDEDGYFWKDVPLFMAHAKSTEIRTEIDAQLSYIHDFGLCPTHIDCHMYSLFCSGTLFRVYSEAAEEWKLPALGRRSVSSPGKIFSLNRSSQIDHFTDLYMKMISKDWQGVAQLTTHPGYDTPELKSMIGATGPWGAEWRQADLVAISSANFREFMLEAGIQQVGWRIAPSP